jgi:hypothetical protein
VKGDRTVWKVHGDDQNVFGDLKRRNVEVIATSEEEAKEEALKHFPTMVIDFCHDLGRDAIV